MHYESAQYTSFKSQYLINCFCRLVSEQEMQKYVLFVNIKYCLLITKQFGFLLRNTHFLCFYSELCLPCISSLKKAKDIGMGNLQ